MTFNKTRGCCYSILSFCFFLLAPLCLFAQHQFSIKGYVSDSTGKRIGNIPIAVFTKNDTVYTTTDTTGVYASPLLKGDYYVLRIKIIGYSPFESHFVVKGNQKIIEVAPVILKKSSILLKEVLIKEKRKPVLIKKDTIEYDAGAFPGRKGEMIQDLLRRFPGLSVDSYGNVYLQGEPITRLKVNGKDFFSGNVSEYISQLPDSIVSKVQIVNDYGDQANYTGIRSGEGNKIMNLVLKPGLDKGKFGQANASGETINCYGLKGNGNYWAGVKQMSANVVLNTTNNTLGASSANGIGFIYKDKWGKNLSVNGSYDYSSNKMNSSITNYSQTLDNNGTLYTKTSNIFKSSSHLNRATFTFNYLIDTNNNLTISPSWSYLSGAGNNQSVATESGLINQVDKTNAIALQKSPSINGSLFFAHRFKNPQRAFSVSLALMSNNNQTSQSVSDRINYAVNNTADSTLNRLMAAQINERSVVGIVNYSEPLGKRVRLNLIYNFKHDMFTSIGATDLKNADGSTHRIDSLTENTNLISEKQVFESNVFFNAKRFDALFGVSIFSTTQSSHYQTGPDVADLKVVNFAPTARFNYIFSGKSSMDINYNGSSMSPSPLQLQRTADTRNLQNILIGNPNLKPSFTHALNINFRNLNYPGYTLMLRSGFTYTQNEIVINSLLVTDSTHTTRQETSYQNANGSYNITGGYSLSLPFFAVQNNKITLSLVGNTTLNNNVSYVNNLKNQNKNFLINQSANTQINTQKLTFELSTGINYSSNRFELGESKMHQVLVWKSYVHGGWFITEKTTLNIEADFSANNGYQSSLPRDIIIVNSSLNRSVLSNNLLSIYIGINDLFNKGNSLSRSIQGNMITDSQTQNVTRFLTFGLQSHFSKFTKNSAYHN